MILVYILIGTFLTISIQAEPLDGKNVQLAKEGKYPFLVSLAIKNDQIYEEQLHFCTGVLIEKKFVLTAAHCLNEKTLDGIKLIMGSVDLREGRKYDASMWVTYNQWADRNDIRKKKANNDIAIIKITEKVGKRVAEPVSLSFKKNNDLINKSVILTGWGRINNNYTKPRFLQEVEVKILPNEVCEKMTNDLIGRKVNIHDRYLCSKGDPHAFLASGDSGGPLLMNNTVVGINKGACLKDGICDAPIEVFNKYQYNIHMNIDYYQDFIVDVLKFY